MNLATTSVKPGIILDRLYVCTTCNGVFLFKIDVQEHQIRTDHQDGISVWFDDLVRMDDFGCT